MFIGTIYIIFSLSFSLSKYFVFFMDFDIFQVLAIVNESAAELADYIQELSTAEKKDFDFYT